MRKLRSGAMGGRVLERSDSVLWTIAPPGIVLHNFQRRQFLELDSLGYKAWAYLDGARTVTEVIRRTADLTKGPSPSSSVVIKKLRRIIRILAANGFIVERLPDA